jgi:hypothetical protein
LLLRQEHYDKQAADIEQLRDAAVSSDPEQQRHFSSQITQNKWYWLGMGTIADVCLQQRELQARFIRAYNNLAVACDQAGLSSVYSRDVALVFGEWVRNGVL